MGYATLGRGALQPGLGVSKELQAVGDIAITGIVGGVGSRSGYAPKRTPVHGDENGGLYLRKHFSCRTIMKKPDIPINTA